MSKYQGQSRAGRPKGGEERPGRHVGLGRSSEQVAGDVSGRQDKQGRGTAVCIRGGCQARKMERLAGGCFKSLLLTLLQLAVASCVA